MRLHIEQHLDRLRRHDDKIQYVTVTLAADSGTHVAEILVKCHRADLVAEARGHDIYKCVDQAFGKMARQVARLHDKLVNDRSRAAEKASDVSRRPA